jgi:hypothetical protein
LIEPWKGEVFEEEESLCGEKERHLIEAEIMICGKKNRNIY